MPPTTMTPPLNGTPTKKPGWDSVSSRPWERARKAQLTSHPECQDGTAPDCTGVAAEVDHVLGVANDPTHTQLESVCHPCHVARTKTRAIAVRNGDERCQPGSCNCPQPRTTTVWSKTR